jgi:hypothetical protein
VRASHRRGEHGVLSPPGLVLYQFSHRRSITRWSLGEYRSVRSLDRSPCVPMMKSDRAKRLGGNPRKEKLIDHQFSQFRSASGADSSVGGFLTMGRTQVSAMPDQGEGCMLDNSSRRAGRDSSPDNWCHNSPPPWAQGPYPPAPTIGGQCSKDDALLPPPCPDEAMFATCRSTPGVGGICYNPSGPVLCLTATQLAASGRAPCDGYVAVQKPHYTCTAFS